MKKRNTNFLHELRRGATVALTVFFLCVQWGPLTAERSRSGLAVGDPFIKEAALTFDDGPREWGMYELITELRRLEVRGTFFLVGKFIDRYGFIVRDLENAGHELQNHSYTHPRLFALQPEKIAQETERCNESLERLGVARPRFLRPPGGGFNMKIFNVVRRLDMLLGLWSVNPGDYAAKDPKRIASDVLKNVRPGAVILLHSGVPATVEALEEIVRALRERGYRLVTLGEMRNGATA